MIQLALTARDVKLVCEFLAASLEGDMSSVLEGAKFSDVAAAWRQHSPDYVDSQRRYIIGRKGTRRDLEKIRREHDREAALLSRLAPLVERS